MADLVILNDEQLPKLAKNIYTREAEAIQNIKFSSESEAALYLKNCYDNYDTITGLLDDAGEIKRKYASNTTLAPVASDIFDYLIFCANSALQTLRNYTVRSKYLEKIRAHCDALTEALAEAEKNPDSGNVALLAQDACQYRDSMLELTTKYHSSASTNFSKWVKDTGMTFDNLVQKYQAKLKYDGMFKDLDEEKKLQVYAEIVEASGRGKIPTNCQLSKGLFSKELKEGAVDFGTAVLVFKTGRMVWDIYSSEYKIQTATHEAVEEVAGKYGGAILGDVIEVAVQSSAELLPAEVADMLMAVTGLVSGFVGACIVGAFAGRLVDLIFSSGGTAPLSTDGHQCYVSDFPDGEEMARQIAHDDSN